MEFTDMIDGKLWGVPTNSEGDESQSTKAGVIADNYIKLALFSTPRSLVRCG